MKDSYPRHGCSDEQGCTNSSTVLLLRKSVVNKETLTRGGRVAGRTRGWKGLKDLVAEGLRRQSNRVRPTSHYLIVHLTGTPYQRTGTTKRESSSTSVVKDLVFPEFESERITSVTTFKGRVDGLRRVSEYGGSPLYFHTDI